MARYYFKMRLYIYKLDFVLSSSDLSTYLFVSPIFSANKRSLNVHMTTDHERP